MSDENYFAIGPNDGPMMMITGGQGLTLEKVQSDHPNAEAIVACDAPSADKVYTFVGGELEVTAIDPMEDIVSSQELNAIWAAMEEAPVEVNGHFYQVDQAKSIPRFKELIENWEHLDTTGLYWKRLDNSKHLLPNKQALIDLFEACKVARAVRGPQLFAVAEQLKAMPVIRKKDLVAVGWPTSAGGVN